jgi:hypothetical protein
MGKLRKNTAEVLPMGLVKWGSLKAGCRKTPLRAIRITCVLM